jgi:hypothetical protein
MRITILCIGIVQLAVGILQLWFVLWAGEASLHLGSPIRNRGDISHWIADQSQQSAASYQHEATLQVIDTLRVSLDVHLLLGAVFLVLGCATLCIYFLIARRLHPGAPPNNSCMDSSVKQSLP